MDADGGSMMWFRYGPRPIAGRCVACGREGVLFVMDWCRTADCDSAEVVWESSIDEKARETLGCVGCWFDSKHPAHKGHALRPLERTATGQLRFWTPREAVAID
jgi:hypothetical protein